MWIFMSNRKVKKAIFRSKSKYVLIFLFKKNKTVCLCDAREWNF